MPNAVTAKVHAQKGRPRTPPRWPTAWVDPGATQYQMIVRCRRILGLPELDDEQEREGEIRALGALQMARLEDAAADLSPVEFMNMFLAFNLGRGHPNNAARVHRRETGWDGAMLLQRQRPTPWRSYKARGKRDPVRRQLPGGADALEGKRIVAMDREPLLDAVSVVQLPLSPQAPGLHHFFNEAVRALQRQFESVAPETSHVRASFWDGVCIGSAPQRQRPEGLGMDRCSRVGALCAGH